MSQIKILYVVNVDWFFISHRLPLALEAKKRGYEVAIAATNTGRFKELEDLGFKLFDLKIERSGIHPIKELLSVFELIKILKTIKPTIVHNVTLKMAIYGSIACRFVHVDKVVNAISGLGFNYTANRKTKAQKILNILIKVAFRKSGFSFLFQNPDDLQLFKNLKLNSKNKLVVIKGSGVDLRKFIFSNKKNQNNIRFILTARMLKDKGISEFIAASKIVSQKFPNSKFTLVGDIDKENLASYSEIELKNELKDTNINWLGHRNDIFELLRNSDIMVFPSYREGLPKSLIEAAAVGLPIITTNTVGCRECVDEGINGFLVPVANSSILAEKMIELIENPELIKEMGQASRVKAEKEFSLDMVIHKTFKLYE
jgi:glycosyltransferase involved in cell wall biosynthesis